MTDRKTILDFETIDEYLDHFYPNLLAIIITSSVAISGSVVQYYKLKTMGKIPKFEPNDLDIYYMNDDTDGYLKMNRWFDENFRDMDEFERTKFEISLHTNDPMSYNDKDFVTANIPHNFRRIIKYVRPGISKDGRKVDCILLDRTVCESTPKEFIMNFFDFDFCRCYYDGYEFVCGNPESLETMHCVLREVPMLSYIDIDPVDILDYVQRIKDRNFPEHITKLNDPANIFKRIIKYEARGFTIDTSKLSVKRSDLEKSIYYSTTVAMHSKFRQIRKYIPDAHFAINFHVTAGRSYADTNRIYKAKKSCELLACKSILKNMTFEDIVRRLESGEYQSMVKALYDKISNDKIKGHNTNIELEFGKYEEFEDSRNFTRQCRFVSRSRFSTNIAITRDELFNEAFEYITRIYSSCFEKYTTSRSDDSNNSFTAETGLEYKKRPLYELGEFISVLLDNVNFQLNGKGYTLKIDNDFITFRFEEYIEPSDEHLDHYVDDTFSPEDFY